MKDSSIIAFSTGRIKIFEAPFKETGTVVIDSHNTETESIDMGTMTTHTSKNINEGGGPLSAKYEKLIMINSG